MTESIAANLERLSHLSHGSVVRLLSGEEYQLHAWTGQSDHVTHVRYPSGTLVYLGDALPLLKAAVEGGATVQIAGESGGTTE